MIDKDGELDSMFASYRKKPAGAATPSKKEIRVNESHPSSKDVLEEMEKDEQFMKVFQEFVKYDEMVYRFALGMHLRQYENFAATQ